MIIPMTTGCGHTYCYSCIYQWLKCNKECPLCRKYIDDEPTLDPELRESSSEIFELLLDINANNEEETDYLIERRDKHTMVYETDIFNCQLFGYLFDPSAEFSKSPSPELSVFNDSDQASL